jgi:hypothetical protein
MNDERSTTGASTPRRTYATFEMKVQSKNAVIRTVPTNASKAALFNVMVAV